MVRLNVSAFLEKDPRNLLRLLISVALVSMVLILSFGAVSIDRIYSQHLIAQAEEDAVHVAGAFMALESEHFVHIDGDGRWSIMLHGESPQILDRHVRSFLAPFGVVKFKLFDDQRRIVYSTDPTIIGRVDIGNVHLERALGGHNDSKFGRKDRVLDLADEQRLEVDVVETYAPIIAPGGEVIGSFEIYRDVSRYGDGISKATTQTVVILGLILLTVFAAAFVVVKIGTDQLERIQRRLQEMAAIDPLTGVMNRREIITRTCVEIARIARLADSEAAKSLGIIMLDVDHFKKINDLYGHPAGDHALKEISERIQRVVRKSDFVGRYGGEEFLVVLPGASPGTTRLMAERIRQAIRSDPFVFDGISWRSTVSIGIALTNGGEKEFAFALKRADEALYAAKKAGRDQISEYQLSA